MAVVYFYSNQVMGPRYDITTYIKRKTGITAFVRANQLLVYIQLCYLIGTVEVKNGNLTKEFCFVLVSYFLSQSVFLIARNGIARYLELTGQIFITGIYMT